MTLRSSSTARVRLRRGPSRPRRTAPTPSKCPTTSASTGACSLFVVLPRGLLAYTKASSSAPTALSAGSTTGPRRPTVRSGTTGGRHDARAVSALYCAAHGVDLCAIYGGEVFGGARRCPSAGPARASMGGGYGTCSGSPRRRRARSSASTRTKACRAPATNRSRRTSWGRVSKLGDAAPVDIWASLDRRSDDAAALSAAVRRLTPAQVQRRA